MKKIIYVCGTVALILSLSACGEKIEIKEYDKENDVVITDNSSAENRETDVKIQVPEEFETTDSNSEKEELRDAILGEWKPVSAKGKDGEQYSLQLIWGTGIKYGGTFNIYENGSYTEYIGIIGETDPLEGIWEIKGDKVVLTSKTNHKKYVTVNKKDSIDVNYGEYIVRFERNKIASTTQESDNANISESIQNYLNLVAAEDAEPSSMIRELGFDLTIDYDNHDVEFFNKTNIKYDDFKQEMLKYVSESWFENRFAKLSDSDIETFYKNVNGVLYIANVGRSGIGYEVKNITQLEESYLVEYTVILDTMISGTYTAKFNIDSQTYVITYCEI